MIAHRNARLTAVQVRAHQDRNPNPFFESVFIRD